MKYFLLTAILVTSLAAVAQPPARSGQLASITSNYWKDNMKLNPLTATQRGITSYNDQLEISIGQEHRSATRKLCVQYLDSLNTVDRGLRVSDLDLPSTYANSMTRSSRMGQCR